MKAFNYTSFQKAQSIEEVKDQLKTLDTELVGTDMQNLIPFNHTYLIITRSVFEKISTGYFENDSLMKKIDTHFGNYYFHALNEYVHQRSCPEAWNITFDTCKKGKNFQFIYMALGVNAHVNNDLPQTLHDVMNGDLFQKDFLLVNTIIAECLHEVVLSLHEKNHLINMGKNVFENEYALFLNGIIQKWRETAWRNYIELHNKQITKGIIETQAAKKAEILASIDSVVKIPKILLSI